MLHIGLLLSKDPRWRLMRWSQGFHCEGAKIPQQAEVVVFSDGHGERYRSEVASVSGTLRSERFKRQNR